MVLVADFAEHHAKFDVGMLLESVCHGSDRRVVLAQNHVYELNT